MVDAPPSSAAYDYTFTVFTPSYNRAHTLDRVYDSLRRQTFRDFEWLIVNDGSTDNTRALVEQWQRDADFPIRYLYQPNQGKHVASNRGARDARGALFLTLDSDDACVPEALERLKYHWDSIPDDQRPRFSAVTALCMYPDGRAVGTPFPRSPLDSDSLETRYRYKVRGEKWGFQRTEVMRQFPFPEQLGNAYLPENIVWDAIARRYKTRYVNEPLRVYYVNASAQTDQITRIPRDPAGKILEDQLRLNREIDWFRYDPGPFVAAAIRYTAFSFRKGRGVGAQASELHNPLARLLWALALPFAGGYLLAEQFGATAKLKRLNRRLLGVK